jgi:succinate dehydrogenase (ubiquinone) cytochrome b560 subunit
MMISRSLRGISHVSHSLRNIVVRSLSTENGPTYSQQQAAKGRPVSPHVTIYAFPITAVSSVANRFTGLALFGGVYYIGILSVLGVDPVLILNGIGNSMIGPLAKMAVTFPLAYHYLGGVRHIIWDKAPELLETKDVTFSSYALFGVSAVLTLVAAFVKI